MKRRKIGHSLASLIWHTTPDYPHIIFHLMFTILQDYLHFKNTKTKMQGWSLTFLLMVYSAESYSCIPDLFDSTLLFSPSIVLFPVLDMSFEVSSDLQRRYPAGIQKYSPAAQKTLAVRDESLKIIGIPEWLKPWK